MYVQCDGYPDGHPLDTAKWLAGGELVNGIGLKDKEKLVFNGTGCLAAQLIDRLKDGAGNTYVFPMEDFGNCGEEYMYDIIVSEEKKDISMIAYKNPFRGKPTVIFEGTLNDYISTFDKN